MRLSIIFVILFILLFSLTSALEWDYGSLHQHTGFSTWWGYDGNYTIGNRVQATDICRWILHNML